MKGEDRPETETTAWVKTFPLKYQSCERKKDLYGLWMLSNNIITFYYNDFNGYRIEIISDVNRSANVSTSFTVYLVQQSVLVELT